jgi:hypothetical protein
MEKATQLETLLAEERSKVILAQTVHKGKASNSMLYKVESTEEIVKLE